MEEGKLKRVDDLGGFKQLELGVVGRQLHKASLTSGSWRGEVTSGNVW